jgi:hypothetical protein
MAIRIELPPRILPRLRLRWHSAHAQLLRQSRALREYATRTTAVPRARWRHVSDTMLARLSLRAYTARRQRIRLDAFEAHYENLIDLLCWAAKDGDHTDRDTRYAELRVSTRRHYRDVRKRLRRYWDSPEAGTSHDPFEALFLPTDVDEVINSVIGIENISQTRTALDAYRADLNARLR